MTCGAALRQNSSENLCSEVFLNTDSDGDNVMMALVSSDVETWSASSPSSPRGETAVSAAAGRWGRLRRRAEKMLACVCRHRACPRSVAEDLCHVDERSSEHGCHPSHRQTPANRGDTTLHYRITSSNWVASATPGIELTTIELQVRHPDWRCVLRQPCYLITSRCPSDQLSIDYVHRSLPIFNKLHVRLGKVVVSTSIVYETNRK